MNDINYIEDPSKWGKNIKTSLLEVVNEFVTSIQPDDYIANVPRYQVMARAKSILNELYFDVVKEIRAIKLEVGPRLQIILPEDYVGYVRLSYVDDEGNVHLMTKNTRNSIAREYLQDDEYYYLFDDDGNILEADGKDHHNLKSNTDDSGQCITISKGTDLFYKGSFKIDDVNGIIQVSSDLAGYEIVLEYMSDGLEKREFSKIFIHKFAKKALIEGIYYELIERRRNVPEYAILRARKKYYNEKRKAKARINAMNYTELFKTLTEYT